MKHIKSLSRPHRAQGISPGAVIGALAQIMQLLGKLLIEKDLNDLNPGPYDW